MVFAVVSIYGLATSDGFALDEVEISQLRYADAATVRSNLLVGDGANLFALDTGELAGRVAALPAVKSVRIEIQLPRRLVVQVEEQEPILVWQVDTRRYLADGEGLLFAEVQVSTTGPEFPGLPVITDRRVSSAAGLAVGDSIEPVVLDAATRLASLVPADIGSSAGRLLVVLDDASGFELHADDAGWTAIFGFYTASLRTPEIIPGQIRLLRSLLAGREAEVARVILADETSGTYLPRASVAPAGSVRP
jgi:hypothetical protein